MNLRAYQTLLIVSFCALLCAPGVSMLVKPEVPKLYGVKEVPYPRFKSLTAWPADFEAYFAANLGHKRGMVELYNWLGYRVLGDLQSDAVLVGKHDWLFLKQNYGWESMRSEEPLSPSEAKGWLSGLDSAEHWLRKRNVKFLFVIVPSKETIYPEFLPKSAPHARSTTRLDEMLAVLQGGRAETLELRAPLLAARAQGPAQLYDSVDSHWNANGSRVGARLIMEHVAQLLGATGQLRGARRDLASKRVRKGHAVDLVARRPHERPKREARAQSPTSASAGATARGPEPNSQTNDAHGVRGRR